MAISYELKENYFNTNAKQFYAKSVIGATLKKDALIGRIIEMGTSLNKLDIEWVIGALRNVIKNVILEGQSVNIDDFLSFSPSVKSQFDSLNEEITSNNLKLNVRVSLSRKFMNEIRQKSEFKKVDSSKKIANITSVTDISTGEKNNSITKGHLIKIEGQQINFHVNREDEGVYLKKENAEEIKLHFEGNLNGSKEIMLLLPLDISLSANERVKFIIRKRKPNSNKLIVLDSDFFITIKE